MQGRAVGQCRNGSVRAAELTRDLQVLHHSDLCYTTGVVLQGPLFTSLTSSLVWLGVVTPEYSAYLDPLVRDPPHSHLCQEVLSSRLSHVGPASSRGCLCDCPPVWSTS